MAEYQYGGYFMLSQFRKTRFSCFHAFAFIFLLTLIFSFYTSNVYSAQATLSWNPNSESELAGYKVYYGNSSRSYSFNDDVGNQTSYTIANLVEGEIYFFAVTAYDFSGNESGYSNEVSYAIPTNEIIIDNGDPETSFTGAWGLSGASNPWDENSLYSNSSSTYTFDASVNGTHEVSLWWTYYNNRCTSVQVDIHDGNTNIGTVFVNQQANGGQWYYQGTYTFNSGTARVVINSQGGCTTCADAVKFVTSGS